MRQTMHDRRLEPVGRSIGLVHQRLVHQRLAQLPGQAQDARPSHRVDKRRMRAASTRRTLRAANSIVRSETRRT